MRRKNQSDSKVFEKEKVEHVLKTLPLSDKISDVSHIFKVLGDETRMKIVFSVMIEELNVSDIANILNMEKSAVSHQLKILKNTKILKSNKVGKLVFYSLDDEHVEMIVNEMLKHASHN